MTMTSSDLAVGIMYLTVRRDWNNSRRLHPVKITAKPPRVIDTEDVVVKVRVRVPVTAFMALDAGELDVTPESVMTVAVVDPEEATG